VGRTVLKRVASLDALRGAGILLMIPVHTLLAILVAGGGGDLQHMLKDSTILGLLLGVAGPSEPLVDPIFTFWVILAVAAALLLLRRWTTGNLLPSRRTVLEQGTLLVFTAVGAAFMAVVLGIVAQAGWNASVTPIAFFFFVTGAALALMIHRRRQTGDLLRLTRHTLVRYLSLIIIGTSITIVTHPELISQRLSAWANPVAAVGLTDLIAFPLVLILSWKMLFVAGVALGALVPFTFLSPIPQALPEILAAPFLTGTFSVCKTLSLVLMGAGASKIFLTHKEPTRSFFFLGVAGLASASLLALLFPVETAFGMHFYLITAIVCFLGLLIWGATQFAHNRGVSLALLTVFGRMSLPIFVAHWALVNLLAFLGAFTNLSIEWTAAYCVLLTVLMWSGSYRILRWRQGGVSE